MSSWDVPDSRATRDIDFLAFLGNSPENLVAVFHDICTIEGDDGLAFDPDSVDAKTIKEDADYEGVRVRFLGLLGKARITMQINIGFKAELLEKETLEKLWSAFLAKTGLTAPKSFHEVLDEIALFLGPLFERVDHLQ